MILDINKIYELNRDNNEIPIINVMVINRSLSSELYDLNNIPKHSFIKDDLKKLKDMIESDFYYLPDGYMTDIFDEHDKYFMILENNVDGKLHNLIIIIKDFEGNKLLRSYLLDLNKRFRCIFSVNICDRDNYDNVNSEYYDNKRIFDGMFLNDFNINKKMLKLKTINVENELAKEIKNMIKITKDMTDLKKWMKLK